MKYLLLACASLFTLQTNAQSFEAGLWKTKESIKVNGIALPESSSQECVTEAQAKDAKAAIQKELKKQNCALTKWTVKNQKLDAAITCKSKDIEASGNLSGDFGLKSYNLTGEAQGTFMQALPATANLALSGQWIRKCSKK